MKRSGVLLALVGVVVLVFASTADAHILSKKRAIAVVEREAERECERFASCTEYGWSDCVRRSAHRIRCKAIVQDEFTRCTWPVQVRIKQNGHQRFVSSNPNRDAECVPR
jgi:hypothetical protein